METLSTHNRNEILSNISAQQFDIIIIGGGITGAGIALDAASRGIKTLVIEKYDFASGTSSRSTKLIHGGLRYLKQLEFTLVRKVGIERAVIHQLAPHLVKPIHMLLPIYKKGSLGKYSTSLALFIYDFLAKVKLEDRYRMLNATQVADMEPAINTHNLTGGAVYKEYRTDDARLTIEVLKTAAHFGATILNYAHAESFIYTNEKISGVTFRNLIDNKLYEAKAYKIINASGPWVDGVRKIDAAIDNKRLHLTKGVHIVVQADRFPIKNAIYFDVEQDKRMIFVIPRNAIVYIGTTDTNYTGDKDFPCANAEDVQYLLRAVNHIFPSANLRVEDICSSWAGLRPLIHKEGKKPSELSRKDEIFISPGGLISIAGGKLTGYRKMAQTVVDKIVIALSKTTNKTYKQSITKHCILNGAQFENENQIHEYIERRAGEAKQIGLNYADIEYLVNTYGTDTEIIIEKAFQLYNHIQDPKLRILKAELLYAVEFEMVCNISDFLIRRTGRLYFDRESAGNSYLIIASMLGDILKLSESEIHDQIIFFEEAYASAISF